MVETRGSTSIGRRAVVRGAAWSVPVVVLATPVPAIAASCTYVVTIVNSLAAGSGTGVDLYIRDTKFSAPPLTTASFIAGLTLPVLTFLVTCNGVPASGVSVAVAADGQTDIEGVPLVKFVSPTIPTNVTEGTLALSPYLGTTDATGQVSVAVATATFGGADIKPRNGTFTVTVGATVATFTYRVFDGAPLS